MTVVDHEPGGWFLIRDGDRLLLDVNCSHGAVSYPFFMELDESERAAYAACGHAFISELAGKVQDAAPGAIGNVSPYRQRMLQGPDQRTVDEATIAWVKERGRAT